MICNDRTRAFTLALQALCLMLTLGGAQADAPPAGVVLAASGEVTAQAPEQAPRDMSRRSPFYAGDVLRTGTEARAQLRFSDGSLLALRPGSELRIDAYAFDPAKSDTTGNHSAASLLKGGLRTITGAIGKQDPKAYKVTTPVATIGVRGTHYEAVLEGAGLSVAAWSGHIVVENQTSSIVLGAEQAYAFARIERADRPPQGLLQPPPVFKQELAPNWSAPDASAGEVVGGSTGDTNTTQNTTTFTGTSTTTFTKTNDPAPRLATTNNTFGTVTTCDSCNPPQQNPIGSTTQLPVTQDLRFSNAEWLQLKGTPYLGMLVIGAPNSGGPGGMGGLFGGQALFGANPNSPIVVDRGVGPHQPGFLTAPIQKVIRQGQAALWSGPANPYAVVWGEWNGQIGPGPIRVQTDASDPTVVSPLAKPVWFAVATPTPGTVLATRSGNVNYNVPVAAIGNGSGGPITSLTFAASVNFDSGLVTGGNLAITNAETWSVNFTGALVNGYLNVNPLSMVGTVNGLGAVQGDLGALVIGNAGQALAGGFDLEKVGDPNTHVEGLFIVECAGAPGC